MCGSDVGMRSAMWRPDMLALRWSSLYLHVPYRQNGLAAHAPRHATAFQVRIALNRRVLALGGGVRGVGAERGAGGASPRRAA
eukprot:2487682-Rhodomonas_salina.3